VIQNTLKLAEGERKVNKMTDTRGNRY